MENLTEKVYGFVRKGLYEVSYYTGIGWSYRKGDETCFNSRKRQRYNKISNDLLSKSLDN